MREREPVHGHFREVIEDRDPVSRGVVVPGPVGHLDQKATRSRDEQRQKMVGGDDVGFDAEPKDPQSFVKLELPDWSVPVGRATFQSLGPPDVVHEDVDVAVRFAYSVCQAADVLGVEMIGDDRYAVSAQRRDELGGFLDRLGPVVIRVQ